jgi:cobaltochelatase CobN
MSIDVYAEDVIAHAKCVVIRLLGGLEYWRYGAEEVAAICARNGIPLAILPGDGRPDPRLADLSTMPPPWRARLDALLTQGGPANMRAALALAAHAADLGPDDAALPVAIAPCGVHDLPQTTGTALAVIVFYRAYLLAGDMAPIDALAAALGARGLAVRALYVASLKEPESAAFVAARLRDWRPRVVLNATGFAARQDDTGSPLDAADTPVLQLVLAGSGEAAWQASSRGLSQADLAMQVVMPELDGRLLTTAISFKEAEPDIPGLEFARLIHRPHAPGITIAANRAAAWARLAATPRAERRIALVLSDYPNAAGQLAHAVGLDSFASTRAVLRLLREAGYHAETPPDVVTALTTAPPTPILDLATYRRLFTTLPQAAQDRVIAAWGEPEGETLALRHVTAGNIILAIEPPRGSDLDRKASYHDPDLPPTHLYIAFHLWLHATGVHALLHLGAHGALEWLPGKSTSLSESCFPQALLGGLPVIYPFIANNPGEAAAAKRRLGAVTIGHLTPPLRAAGLHGRTADLEKLIDEYAAADGLDRRRASLLRRTILDMAGDEGVLAESGVANDTPDDEALARLDAYLCDIKDLQIRDGLHIFGQPPCPEARDSLLASLQAASPSLPPAILADRLDRSPEAENTALLAALDGRFVPPGPAGAPTRGRADVLPTGRNLSTTDPRTMPTRAAIRLAERAAEDLLRRHRQDHGEYPREILLDLWGSASLRTGGEDLGLALVLLGARPTWDDGSNRVTGIEILPVAILDRPRVDVTLRISGLFRDAFETQIALFDSAVRAIAARDEADDWNPLAASARGLSEAAFRTATARIFGAAPGAYGAGLSDMLGRNAWTTRDDLGRAYLAASSAAYGQNLHGDALPDAFARRVATADAFLHQQDHRELDLLEGAEHAAHEGGFAAAAASLGNSPALYHSDTSRPEVPHTATIAEEIAKITRARAANPAWIAGMMRHGYRGAAEIARAVEGLTAFAATLPNRLDPQFDLLFNATLANPDVNAFLLRQNPAAHADIQSRFRDAAERGLWHPRRNDIQAGGTS